MIYDAQYRMTDIREESGDVADDEIVSLKPTPGGILYFTDLAGAGKKLEWDDDADGTFIDDEENGKLIITTAEGSVLFTKVQS